MATVGGTSKVAQDLKYFLIVLIIVGVAYFVWKYQKWIKAGLALLALADAAPFLIDIIAGILGMGSAVVAFIKARMKAKVGTETDEPTDPDPEDPDGKNVADLLDKSKGVAPNSEGKASVNVKNSNGDTIDSFENTDTDSGEKSGDNTADEDDISLDAS